LRPTGSAWNHKRSGTHPKGAVMLVVGWNAPRCQEPVVCAGCRSGGVYASAHAIMLRSRAAAGQRQSLWFNVLRGSVITQCSPFRSCALSKGGEGTSEAFRMVGHAWFPHVRPSSSKGGDDTTAHHELRQRSCVTSESGQASAQKARITSVRADRRIRPGLTARRYIVRKGSAGIVKSWMLMVHTPRSQRVCANEAPYVDSANRFRPLGVGAAVENGGSRCNDSTRSVRGQKPRVTRRSGRHVRSRQGIIGAGRKLCGTHLGADTAGRSAPTPSTYGGT
jgi:hypothetical protein